MSLNSCIILLHFFFFFLVWFAEKCPFFQTQTLFVHLTVQFLRGHKNLWETKKWHSPAIYKSIFFSISLKKEIKYIEKYELLTEVTINTEKSLLFSVKIYANLFVIIKDKSTKKIFTNHFFHSEEFPHRSKRFSITGRFLSRKIKSMCLRLKLRQAACHTEKRKRMVILYLNLRQATTDWPKN